MAESTTAGSGRLLGTENLQRAVDSVERTVKGLGTVMSTLVPVMQQWQSGARGASSWNRATSWISNNAGNATFNGQPPQNGGNVRFPSPSTGTPNGGGTQPTTPTWWRPGSKPPTGGAPTGGSPATTGGGNGWATAGFITTAAMNTVKQIYNNVGPDRATEKSDLHLYGTYGPLMSHGEAVDTNRLFGRNQNSALNGADAVAAAWGASQHSGYVANSAGFDRYRNMVGAQSIINPNLSGADAQAAVAGFHTARGFNMMRMVGIRTLGKGGVQKSPTMIANEVLKQVDPQGQVTTPDQIAALVDNPISPLNQTLTNWVANGVIGPDQQDLIISNVRAILQARQHGMGAKTLEGLITRAESNNGKTSAKAFKQLDKTHVTDNWLMKHKDQEASLREGTAAQVKTFTDAAMQTAEGLQGVTDAANALQKPLRDMQGTLKGLNDQGKRGFVAGVGHMIFGHPASSGSSYTAGSTSGSGVNGTEAGSLTPPNINPSTGVSNYTSGGSGGVGGDNEGRMSVLAMRGRESVTSGTPHSAVAAAMGDYGAGGAVGPGGEPTGGGNTVKPKKGSSGQRMILPAKGPLGAYFGQKGAMWKHTGGHHTGQDIRCPTGTPVHAPADGTVIFAGVDGGYGNLVKIDHGGGVVSYLAHNSRFVAHVGAKVRQGQLVAYSGATGNITGPHCHFEVRVNGRSVNPMRYVSGGGRVPGGGGAGTAGSGTSDANGMGTATTASTSGGGMSAAGIGMSELDVLSAALSGGGAAAAGASSGSGDSGTGTTGGTGGTTPTGSIPGAPTSVSGNKAIVKRAAARHGWGSGKEWDALYAVMMQESGFRNKAQNPTSTAYGMFQFLDSTWAGYGGKKTSDPTLQAKYGMAYIKGRYTDPIGAWNHEKAMGWYAKGAWDLKDDEVAQVHKGEMIIPKPQAQQIREVLLHNNSYGAGKRKGGGEGVVLKFEADSIKINLGDSGATTAQGQALGKGIVDAIASDRRIKALQNGSAHG